MPEFSKSDQLNEFLQKETSSFPKSGKFRKKPVVISAVKYEPGAEIEGVETCGCDNGRGEACAFCGKVFIETLEGNMVVSPGDYVITGVKGEKYPCKPDIFESTYEPAILP